MKLQRYAVSETFDGLDFEADDAGYWVKGPEADAEIERLRAVLESLLKHTHETYDGVNLIVYQTDCPACNPQRTTREALGL